MSGHTRVISKGRLPGTPYNHDRFDAAASNFRRGSSSLKCASGGKEENSAALATKTGVCTTNIYVAASDTNVVVLEHVNVVKTEGMMPVGAEINVARSPVSTLATASVLFFSSASLGTC